MKIKGKNMLNYLLFALYIVISASGLLFIKAGGNDLVFGINSGKLNLVINLKMLLGMFFYVCSFLLFLYIMPKFNLTYIYPVSAGILYIIIAIAGVLILKETITLWQFIGMAFILIGVIAMNIKK
jgi:drug/metabolite transporter (DMT)-like permease